MFTASSLVLTTFLPRHAGQWMAVGPVQEPEETMW